MAQLVEQWNTSFSRGMNDSAAPSNYREDEAALLLNYRVTPDGQAEVRYGSQRLHTSALNSGAQGYGGIQFTTAAGVKQLCVFVGDSFFYSTNDGTTWTTPGGGTGLRTDYWSLATMRVTSTNYLLAANGGTSSYKWDGTSFSAISNIDSGTKYIAVHNERLWSYASGVTVKGSKIRDPETWATPDGLTLTVISHDGDTEITGLFSLGPILLAFKRSSTAYIEGYGNSDVIVQAGALGLSRDVGCIAHRSVVAMGGGGAMWLSERGFEFLQPGGQPELVSGQVENFMRDIAWADIQATPGLPQAIFYPRKLTYECDIPGAGVQNNYTFVYRIPTQGRPGAPSLLTNGALSGSTLYVDSNGYLNVQADTTEKRMRSIGGYLDLAAPANPGLYVDVDANSYLSIKTQTYDAATTFTADIGADSRAPLLIGYDGFVRRRDYGTLDDLTATATGGSAVPDKLRSKPMLLQDPFREKWGRIIRVLGSSTSAQTPSVLLVADGTAGTAQTPTLAASEDGEPREARVRVSGRGRTLHVEVRSAGAGTKISAVSLAAEKLVARP